MRPMRMEHTFAMATVVHIPVSEYLRTSYEPDCDYVDGELVERHTGTEWHSLVMSAVGAIFTINRHSWKLRAMVVQRIRTSETRYHVADICVVPSSRPLVGIVGEPPVLCVEVLSPEDRFSRVVERVQEYTRMGVPHVWIIDPISREIWTVQGSGGPVPLEGTELTLPNTPVRIPVAEIFAEIDEAPPAPAE